MGRLSRSLATVGALFLCLGVVSGADAAIYNPASDGLTGWTATPGFVESIFSNDSNTNLGNQGHVLTELQTSSWLNTTLTSVTNEGGNCGSGGVTCSSSGNGGSYSGTGANVFALHFGNDELVLVYSAAISNFSISNGLPFGLSNIQVFDGSFGGTTPLPPALPFFALGLVMLGLLAWRSSRSASLGLFRAA